MKDEYTDFFAKEAKSEFELIVVDKDEIPESYLRKFDYLVFPDNVAIVLGIAEAVGIDHTLQGMLNAPADPGAVRIKYFHANNTKMCLLMLLQQTNQIYKAILNKLESYNYPYKRKSLFLNCRSDRIDRTQLFVEFLRRC